MTVIYVDCPPVPPCLLPTATIQSNGDLALALGATINAFKQCKIAKELLQKCIDVSNQGRLEHE